MGIAKIVGMSVKNGAKLLKPMASKIDDVASVFSFRVAKNVKKPIMDAKTIREIAEDMAKSGKPSGQKLLNALNGTNPKAITHISSPVKIKNMPDMDISDLGMNIRDISGDIAKSGNPVGQRWLNGLNGTTPIQSIHSEYIPGIDGLVEITTYANGSSILTTVDKPIKPMKEKIFAKWYIDAKAKLGLVKKLLKFKTANTSSEITRINLDKLAKKAEYMDVDTMWQNGKSISEIAQSQDEILKEVVAVSSDDVAKFVPIKTKIKI